MEVVFVSRKLERCYDIEALAIQEWGPVAGRSYGLRVDAIHAAAALTELRAFQSLRIHPLGGDRSGQWAMTLHGRWRLVFAVDQGTNTATIEEVSNHYDQ